MARRKLCYYGDGSQRIDVPSEAADIILLRLKPLIHANVHAPNVLQSLMLSCYLQGAMDCLGHFGDERMLGKIAVMGMGK